MAGTVSSLDCDVTIVGRKTDNCANDITVPFRTIRFRMLFKKGFLFYKFFNIRLFFYLIFHKSDLLVSNDLDTLLPNYLVSRLKGIPLVYDSHEYFTNLPELTGRHLVRSVWLSIESSIFPHLRNVITVSEPIAEEYEKLYNVRPIVVRNASRNSDAVFPFSREELSVPDNNLLIIMQGTGINIDKGAEELIAALKIVNDVSLMIVGSGDVISLLKEQADNLCLGNRVRFIPPLPWGSLMRYTRTADIGMCLEKDTNLNYRYSLPNKLFDYISAGIPVIAGDLPETGKIIRDNDLGIIIPAVTPENIAGALNLLKNNRERQAGLKENAIMASKKINWEAESKKVIELYSRILDDEIRR
jgi:glycosyltransferase involved in cell wall biosynthesis